MHGSSKHVVANSHILALRVCDKRRQKWPRQKALNEATSRQDSKASTTILFWGLKFPLKNLKLHPHQEVEITSGGPKGASGLANMEAWEEAEAAATPAE